MPQEIEQPRRDNNNTPDHTKMDVEHSESATQTETTQLEFNNLPTEIHEAILDQLFGARSSLNAITPATTSTCSWSKSLRHPRRKILSDLALVCPAWRTLVQERIYRHIKVQGTTDGLQNCADWFSANPHLSAHIRHIEVWVPVWGDRLRQPIPHHIPSRREYNMMGEANGSLSQQASISAIANFSAPVNHGPRLNNFRLASRKATLQQIFYHVRCFFPDAKMLTIEGGHCKKPPMITHFDNEHWNLTGEERLEKLPNIQSFVMRGAWNIMRDYGHWQNMIEALPNLREWNCSYAKPKLVAQLMMGKVLSEFPSRITRLDLCLDGFSSKNKPSYLRFQKAKHLCSRLGAILPQLESLTYTGVVCECMFKDIVPHTDRYFPLRSVNLVVKGCCCETRPHENGPPVQGSLTGITSMGFINAFEKLVLSAVRSLKAFPSLDYMRIRYVDLDTPCDLLNPYFQLNQMQCTGFWSYEIVKWVMKVRPVAEFPGGLKDGVLPEYGISMHTGTREYPESRPLSLWADAYQYIADLSKP